MCGAPEYRCGSTAELREKTSIEDTVTFITWPPPGDTSPTDPSDSLAISTQLDTVWNLSCDQLVTLVSDLKTEVLNCDEDRNVVFEVLDACSA